MWKEHAYEFLEITSYLGKPKIVINYTRWVLERKYRQQIASSLQLPYHEETLSKVVGREGKGAGSSFDGVMYSGKASEMKIFERWQKMKDNRNYRSLFEDEEVWELSKQIFGDILGTEYLHSA